MSWKLFTLVFIWFAGMREIKQLNSSAAIRRPIIVFAAEIN